MKQLRILRIADVPNTRTGGMSRVMHYTGDAMIAAGHQVDYLFDQDLKVSTKGPWRRFAVPWRLPALISKLNTTGTPYDIVEMHEPLAAAYCAAKPFMQHLPPVCLVSYGLSSQARHAKLDYMKRQGMAISLKERYAYLSVVFQAEFGMKNASHVICPNSATVQYLLGVGIPASRITQYHSGVDKEFLAAGELSPIKPRDINRILFMGSWITRKGTMDLVRAATPILKQQADRRLVVAGCGYDAHHVLSDFPGDVRPQIEVIPKIQNNGETISLLRGSGLFVLPSYFEGQPLAMLEAAAMGLPIVATDIPGINDFISHGINGLLVPVADAVRLREELLRLMSDEQLATRLGEAARLRACDFTWASAAQKFLAAYRSAVERKDDRHT